MGSKRWRGAGFGPVGYFIGRHKEHEDKKRRREYAARRNAAEAEKNKNALGDPEGGGDPFASDTTEVDKKKKVNTLIAGGNTGALGGADGSRGALTLGV